MKAGRLLTLVIPAQAGIQAPLSSPGRMSQRSLRLWVPAFAGTTHGTPSLWHALSLRKILDAIALPPRLRQFPALTAAVTFLILRQPKNSSVTLSEVKGLTLGGRFFRRSAPSE